MDAFCKPKKVSCNRTLPKLFTRSSRCSEFKIPEPNCDEELVKEQICFENQKFNKTFECDTTRNCDKLSVISTASSFKSGGKNNEDYLKDTRPKSKVMSLQVRFGSDIHHMNVENKNSFNIQVSDVMRHIEKDLKIPMRKQNLFFRGMDIKKYASTDLELLGIYQNCVIRCVGQSENQNFLEKFIKY